MRMYCSGIIIGIRNYSGSDIKAFNGHIGFTRFTRLNSRGGVDMYGICKLTLIDPRNPAHCSGPYRLTM